MNYKVFIVLVSISLIVIGVLSREVNVVLQKATRICLECIGVG